MNRLVYWALLTMDFQIVIQLVLAVVLGGLIGIEREQKGKQAGLRTYSLVCLGAALFTIISFETLKMFQDHAGAVFDPVRMAGQVVLGIGFLGAGLIVFRESRIEGLTTAAGLWVTAGVGVAVGTQLYFPAAVAALLAIIILSGLRIVEEKFFKKT